MKYLSWVFRLVLMALFGLSAIDGICQVRGIELFSPLVENLLVAAFFLVAAMTVFWAWYQKDQKALIRIRRWAGLVLLGSLLLLLLLWVALSATMASFWVDVFLYGLTIVSAPIVSCTVMYWPIFGWILLLLTSWNLTRQKKDKVRRKRPFG